MPDPAPSADEVALALEALRGGDINRYETLVAAYQRPLRAYLLRSCPDPEDADDLAQNAFLLAYERLDRFERGGDFGAWLFGIAKNLVRRAWEAVRDDAQRRSSLERTLQKRLAERAAAEAEPGRDERWFQALRLCIGALPDSWRQVVALHYGQKEPIQAIAERLGNSSSSVGVTLFRTRNRLRECVERRLAGGEEST